MFYSTSDEGDANVELKMSATNGASSLEVDVVALRDLPAGCRLIRKGPKREVDVKYGDVHNMSDEELDAWFLMWAKNDLEDAAKINAEPENLREETIREHFRLSREGKIPLVDASKTQVMPHPVFPGYGVFATQDIKEGEIIEYGFHRKIAGLNGDKCPYVFTWNSIGRRMTQAEGPNQWGQGAGNIMFYNSDSPPNARLFRLYGGWRFVLVARRDIAVGEEVMHLYKSSSWRKCFVEDEYLPKEQPIEVRSRAGSECTPGLGPQQAPDVLLGDLQLNDTSTTSPTSERSEDSEEDSDQARSP